MKKITRQEIGQNLSKFSGEIKKLPSGTAQGATSGGTVCAAGFGSSLLGQAQQRSTYFKNKKQQEEMKKRTKKIKKNKAPKRLATEKQKKYMQRLGVKFHERTTINEARNSISQYLRISGDRKNIDTATEKQKNLMKVLNVPFSKEMSRSEASDLIDSRLMDDPSRRFKRMCKIAR